MLHLALKACYPAKPPFPLLHVDTTWKFRDTYDFRDATATRLDLELIVHVNQEGLDAGIGPISHGSAIHTSLPSGAWACWRAEGTHPRVNSCQIL